jgi:hypothetical protein
MGALGKGTSPSPQHTPFDYHSGFWVNLHQFLYEEADGEASRSKPLRFRPELAADAAVLTTLSAAERKHRKESVAYYVSKMIDHDLLMDPNMVRLKDRLEDLEGAEVLGDDSGLDPDLVATLERAAPIYRADWWPQHDAENRAWIAAVSPLVDRYGDQLGTEIAAAYDTQWPNEPVRVDVTAYANWAGAYTSLFPTRVAISSADAANQGGAALEVIFHESSHALIDNVQEAIAGECSARKLRLPSPTLWHAVLFFTAGYYVRRLQPGYTPYADQNGLWTRAWPNYRAALVKDWQPHLEGRASLRSAIAQLVGDVAIAEPRQ